MYAAAPAAHVVPIERRREAQRVFLQWREVQRLALLADPTLAAIALAGLRIALPVQAAVCVLTARPQHTPSVDTTVRNTQGDPRVVNMPEAQTGQRRILRVLFIVSRKAAARRILVAVLNTEITTSLDRVCYAQILDPLRVDATCGDKRRLDGIDVGTIAEERHVWYSCGNIGKTK